MGSDAPGTGGQLLVELPFAIPGDAGVESMWVEVTRFERADCVGYGRGRPARRDGRGHAADRGHPEGAMR